MYPCLSLRGAEDLEWKRDTFLLIVVFLPSLIMVFEALDLDGIRMKKKEFSFSLSDLFRLWQCFDEVIDID